MSNPIYSIPVNTIDHQSVQLEKYKGSVLLVVNVASQCGLTQQYEGLENLYKTYREQGFEVLGFPSNEFAGQEPGSDEEIQAFCRGTFGVEFPMFSKIEVNGPQRHPLYQQLIAAKSVAVKPEGSEFYQRLASKGREPKQPGDILWNFEKFLIGRDGVVLERFAPDMTPEDPILVAAITQALGRH
ncbi:glutathione peroxidase [Yersinia mollaretii]|uniref:Thioredoxin/glutathione peroxidase BtuE n=1 Tax=Yersinia mollaretii (strain ATCC 43969 / DSM 18520 / CIP 103324 / CNY 7263 / WAIP 204) TaxID=349967 RepID=A0ABP2EGG7_YERMW|nr:glutathione peroxidase [Yersinia mollaretii]EEQ11583.1 Vitamin B12 transport periplasmic protein btuE [Yersinia mollaretii ATCC 43969]MDN0112442.1 glutathione peroxidase [Yersinia mollaretii]PJE89345.1 glutathione peroxidase [Yersinia mollaretii]QKJ04445.1 glutathione peroxidase [Yersinia mollaretii ATCC 43969]CQD43685.1 putative glutathione peroxidase [Yersinia mollaretii]